LIEVPEASAADELMALEGEILGNAGFHELQFAYAQPPLGSGGSPEGGLSLAVLMTDGPEDRPVLSSLLQQALRNAWKGWGIPVDSDPTAQEVLRKLSQLEVVRGVPLEPRSAGSALPQGPVGL
jgi:hypothetical protein